MFNKLKQVFDLVGVIDVKRYPNYDKIEEFKDVKSIFVIGLAYPHIVFKNKEDEYLSSVYTYGLDYHLVLKELVNKTLDGFEYEVLVDNHNLDERKCIELTGLAYKGKNDLMINEDYGSFFFIGLVLTKKRYDEVIVENNDSCGTCEICIKACPVNALVDGFDIDKCLSAENQRKQPLKERSIKKNYLLLGCDICQLVCPKNKNIITKYNQLVDPLSTAYIKIDDLFELTNKEFNKKYRHHAYLWRGKTLLLRNALTILLKYKNTKYNDKIKKTIANPNYPLWYKEDAIKILEQLQQLNM